MFVLEREPDKDIAHYQIAENTTLLMGPPTDPLPLSFVQRLTGNLEKFDFIKEVYQYGQTKKDEFSIVLAFKLIDRSEKKEKTIIDIINRSVQNPDLKHSLDIFFIDSDDMYKQIKAIQNSLIYKT